MINQINASIAVPDGAAAIAVRFADEPGGEAGIKQPFLRRRVLHESRGEPVSNDHFTVSISSLNNGVNDDRRSLSGHTLTIALDGRLSIETDKGRRTFAPAEWDDLEVKMMPHVRTASLTDVGNGPRN